MLIEDQEIQSVPTLCAGLSVNKAGAAAPRRVAPKIRAIWIQILVLTVAGVAFAQVSTSLPPFGSFSGGTDVTNLGNLNIHYTFSIFSKPGRGMPFNYALSLDNSIWYLSGAAWAPVPNWGWRGPTDAVMGWMEIHTITGHCVDPDTGNRVNFSLWQFLTYHDNFGVAHPISGADSTQGTVCSDPVADNGTATDGSGYTVVPTPGVKSAKVIARSGQVIPTALQAVGFGSGTLIDPNGNMITATNGIFTDTLGMNVLTASGGAPSPLVFTYKDTSNTSRNVTVNYSSYTIKTNFGCAGIAEYGPTAASLASNVVYPDGSSYSFTYEPTPGFSGDVTGRLHSVTLPTGATITYNYTGANNGIICADGSTAGFDRVTSDGTISYSRSGSGTNWTTTFQDASSPTRNQTTISFQTAGNNFYETQRKAYQGASTLLLQTDTCYNGAAVPCTGAALTLPFSLIRTYLTLNNSQQSLTGVNLNSFGLPTEVDEYDFGNGTPGSLLRSTITTYNTALGNNIVDHPSSVIVRNGSGVQIAATTFNYDETTPTATSGVPQHAAVTGSRGNLTTLGRWLNTTGTNLNTTLTYDDAGNVLTATDPGGHQTQLSYADNFSDAINRNSLAYVTQVTLPDTNSPGLAHHVTRMQYEPNTGLPTIATDQNNHQTTFTYNLMLRPVQTNFPDGGQTSFSYPSVTQTLVQKKIDATRSTFATAILDSYGRISRSAIANAEATPYDLTDVCYDSNGRPRFQSYPYQAASYTGASVCSGAGDSFTYDALGRPTQVTHSDGASAQLTYTGRARKITDEGNGTYNVTRVLQSDALGRMTGACEVTSTTLLGSGGTPASCGLDIATTGFLTSYGYDTLGNLTTVTQGSMLNRTLAYDSLGRLTSESHPEWGSGSTMTYGYNSDSLLISRVRPAPNQTNPAVTVTTNYGYDALHRLTSRTYTGDPSGTPSAVFNYDESFVWSQTLTNTINRMSSENSGTTGQVFSYDTVGRVLDNWQCTPRNCGTGSYHLSYQHDLAGNVASASNGAGVTFTYTYNTAARPTAMTSSLVDAQHPATLLSNVHYGPFGMMSDSLGNGLTETIGYTARGMLQSYTSTPYSFNLTGLAGNGTITAGNDTVNGNWTYSYDQFNRLATSSKSTAPAQGFSYAYDRYGNRWQQNLTQGNGPAPQYVFDNSTNRISGSGVAYDALGNVTNDGFHSYTYDAENRLIQADGGATATYAYDAEGRRVRNASSEFVYDLAGRAISLFSAANGVWNYGEIYARGRHLGTYSNSTTTFLHTDWLGTKRVVSNLSGLSSQTCTGLPFGDGVSCTGTASTLNGFTDDIHDSETNLEHTWFRQLSGTQGRWMRPDPYLGSMDPANPQSMNRYGYVTDNPINQVDPDGKCGLIVAGTNMDPSTPSGQLLIEEAADLGVNVAFPFEANGRLQAIDDVFNEGVGRNTLADDVTRNAIEASDQHDELGVQILGYSGGAAATSAVLNPDPSLGGTVTVNRVDYFSPGVLNGSLFRTSNTFMARGTGFFDWAVNLTTAGQGNKARIPGVGHSLNNALWSGTNAGNRLKDDVSENKCSDPKVFSRDNPSGVPNGGGLAGLGLWCWVTRDEKGKILAISGCFWM